MKHHLQMPAEECPPRPQATRLHVLSAGAECRSVIVMDPGVGTNAERTNKTQVPTAPEDTYHLGRYLWQDVPHDDATARTSMDAADPPPNESVGPRIGSSRPSRDA